jgi:hypothetical protein
MTKLKWPNLAFHEMTKFKVLDGKWHLFIIYFISIKPLEQVKQVGYKGFAWFPAIGSF